MASFAIDLIFLGGVSGEEGPKAAAVLVILLLWRIARVVDGIVVTVKQRQEFRIRLQKRARRTAEKKMESFEEERHAKTKQIEALKDLCAKAGITDADIAACAPKHNRQVNSTLCALSSVARLSVSMTMLMSSGIYRPRLLDEDGLAALPKALGPRKTKADPADPAAAPQRSSERRNPLPRIESLPIIQDSLASTSGSKQRKMAYAKTGRKQYGAAGSKTYHHHQPVIEANEDGGGSGSVANDEDGGFGCEEEDRESVPPATTTTTTATRATDADSDLRLQNPLGGSSPVNSSGVHILIDGSSDVEADDDDDDPNDDSPAFTGVNAATDRYTNETSSSSSSPEANAAVAEVGSGVGVGAIDWTTGRSETQTSDDKTLPANSMDNGNLTDKTEQEDRSTDRSTDRSISGCAANII